MASMAGTESISSDTCLRPMTCEFAILSRCDGSATLTQGDTCATAAVYGPAEVRIAKEILDKTTVEVIYKSKSGLPRCVDKFHERLIRNTCETAILTTLHPRSSVSVIVQEMQHSGSFLACCINASCLALLDAGVSLKYMVAAVNCAMDRNGHMILDPTSKEEEEIASEMTVVFDSKDFNVITVSAKGDYSVDQLQSCVIACREASKKIFQFYKDSMDKKLSKAA